MAYSLSSLVMKSFYFSAVSLVVYYASSAVAVGQWPVDGGNIYRQSAATITAPIEPSASHITYTWASNAEDTVSEVEFFLLQSPLMTSWGGILAIADNCTVTLLPDPAVSLTKTQWIPTLKSWIPGVDLNYEKEFAGVALDGNDVLYMIDRRDKALHAVQITKFGFSELLWSPVIFNYSHIDFDLDVSLIPNTMANQLWIPIKYTMIGNMGAAIQLSTVDGTYVFIPVGDPDCGEPEDFGSAAINGGSIALLGPTTCGLTVLDVTGAYQYKTYPTERFLFQYGEHSHPVFDPSSQNLYFIDWADSIHNNQFLCCVNSQNGFADCANWPGQCIRIPELSRSEGSTGTLIFRWEWLAAGLWQSRGLMYISGSATASDETIINSVNDLTSVIFVFDVTQGALVGYHRFTGDQFNSPPLVVTGSAGAGSTRIYLSSTLGNIYCYDANNINNGYMWVSNDIPGIPYDDLPATTYSYLTVTNAGTILLTSTAGGADWSDEKAIFAIVNGVSPPPTTPDSNGIAPGAAFGVAVAVLGVASALGFIGYKRSPFVRNVIDNGVDTAKSVSTKMMNFVRDTTGMSSSSSNGSGSGENKSLLSGGGGGGGQASSTSWRTDGTTGTSFQGPSTDL